MRRHLDASYYTTAKMKVGGIAADVAENLAGDLAVVNPLYQRLIRSLRESVWTATSVSPIPTDRSL